MLALTIGIDWTATDAIQQKRLKAAANSLRAAVEATSLASARPDQLDDWIDRHLVRLGSELLLPAALRRTTMARVREGHRRQVHGDKGQRSARIEMSQEGWMKLRGVRAELAAARRQNVTLGHALEHVIAAHGLNRKKSDRRRNTDDGQTSDLLSMLNTAMWD